MPIVRTRAPRICSNTILRCMIVAEERLVPSQSRGPTMDLGSLFAAGIWTAGIVAFLILLRISNIFRYIPNNQVGIVEKLWAVKGSVKSGFIALQGEAG